jgi:alpha-D-xyloside xylohydrolase
MFTRASVTVTCFLLLFFQIPFFVFATQPPAYTKIEDGIIVQISNAPHNAARQVKLQVVSENIFHVTATPLEVIPEQQSLILDEKKRNPVKWDIKATAVEVILFTATTQAKIILSTGEISFLDKAGNVLLQEAAGGKTFTSSTLDGEQSYIVRQAFETAADEGLYGLGQHQAGVFNYKGTQVLLSQYNTEVAVPFMTSSKNYGILWHNNSITKSIDTREYEPLSTLKLFSADGDEGWLTSTYTDKKNPAHVFVSRPESYIDYPYIPSLKKFPDSINLANTLVTWQGKIESGFTGQHVFNFYLSGYTKIFMDGKLIANRWRQSWNPGTELVKINLEKGKKYDFKIEWDPSSSQSYIACTWLKPLSGNNKNEFAFESEAGTTIDYYFVAGSNMDEVISGYRNLTGKATMLPKWAMGFWQSRERYKSQEEILTTVAEFRKRKIPLDNIVEDWSYWEQDKWGSQDFDKTRFPDAAGMIKTLHEKYHTQFMISVWPKFYEGIANYKMMNDSGWMYKRNVANHERDWIGKGYVSSFYDAYNPNARKAFWKTMNKTLYPAGVDAWWLDATEPDINSNGSPQQRKELSTPNYFGSSTKNYNAFALMNAKGVYEGQRATNPGKRVFILTRSSYAGIQKYAAATWSGDIGARWEDFKNQIPAGLNFGLSGMPYWTTDIGGFATEQRYENATGKDLEEWREQMTRWYQYGVFCPLFRVHGQYPYREIFNTAPDDHPAYKSMLYYDKLRYRLMPYIYSLVGQTYHNDYTIMRALQMDFANDTAVKNIGSQYMFGPALLVNPVTDFLARNRTVYLPAGTGWYNLYDGKFIAGGQTITADAPYEQIPLFVKEGSIIPYGPEMEYTAEKLADPITLYVYGGKDASFTLYEDENTNYNYENGQFATIQINYTEAAKIVTIENRKGSFKGMLNNRTFKIILVTKDKPSPLDLQNIAAQKIVKYSGKKMSVSLSK